MPKLRRVVPGIGAVAFRGRGSHPHRSGVGRAGRGRAGPESGGTRPRIGLVLGGGGAKGAAHIGVLRVLDELRFPLIA